MKHIHLIKLLTEQNRSQVMSCVHLGEYSHVFKTNVLEIIICFVNVLIHANDSALKEGSASVKVILS